MARIVMAGWLFALGACSLQVDAPKACSAGGKCDTGFACNTQGFCVPDSTMPSATMGCTLAVTAGDEHSCAIRSDGAAWCWGRNDNGQLGDNTTTDRIEPAAATAKGMPALTAIAGGSNHT
jgi:alpha-tubulin suppressor-like RCC1 family protein